MSYWEILVETLTTDSARLFFGRLGQIITVISAVFAFYNARAAKKALLAEKQQRSRKGEVEYGVTYKTGSKFGLHKLAMIATNNLFTNPIRENLFRKSGNEDRTAIVSDESGPENIGLQDTGDPGENKFFSLTHGTTFAGMFQQSTLWAAAGVPCREVRFLQAFRYDTYSTQDKVDGYQTGRAMLFLLTDIIEAGENPDFLKNETKIAYQRDRLFQMQEVYRVWKSDEASDKWRVIEITMPVPELLFLGTEIVELTRVTEEARRTIQTLRELGGELSEGRLEQLAQAAARQALQNLASSITGN